jgi:hypothetical protein
MSGTSGQSAARWSVCEAMVRGGDLRTDAAVAAEVGFVALGVELDSVLACGQVQSRTILDGCGLSASSVMGLPNLLEPREVSQHRYELALDATAALGASSALVSAPVRSRVGPSTTQMDSSATDSRSLAPSQSRAASTSRSSRRIRCCGRSATSTR